MMLKNDKIAIKMTSGGIKIDFMGYKNGCQKRSLFGSLFGVGISINLPHFSGVNISDYAIKSEVKYPALVISFFDDYIVS